MISFAEFKKMELKVAEVKEAKDHPQADKLMILKIDLGNEVRQIVAGIRGHYSAKELLGKQVVVVVNLEPATLRGQESKGMLLAAQDKGKIVLLTLDERVNSGSPIS